MAKFNPQEPKKPTYFTEALLNTIGKGTEPGRDFITIGEVYIQLRKEIAELKKSVDADIPEPRPVLQGNVNGFLFCKNIKFKNQEDKDWSELREDPSMKKLLLFKEKYPESRFENEMDDLTIRVLEAQKALKNMEENKDIKLAVQIKKLYEDIPYIKKRADAFINSQLAVNASQEDKDIESASFQEPSLKDFSNNIANSSAATLVKQTEIKQPENASFSMEHGSAARPK